jgi:hypothetical protein
VISLKGVFGPPRDLVTRATTQLCQAIEGSGPDQVVKFILMSSVSVNHPEAPDPRRGRLERVFLWILRALVPPAKDNQRAADFLYSVIGKDNPLVQWVAVRPDTLLEGDDSDYSVHETLVSSLFKPASTNMANVAHFMGDLTTVPETWDRWTGRLPVIINAPGPSR